MVTKKSPKNPLNYFCEKCDYITYNKKDYTKHLLTRKHQNGDKMVTKIPKNPQTYICDCGKIYNYRQGLSRHKKICDVNIQNENINIDNTNTNDSNIKLLSNLVMDVVKQNNELTNKIIDICKITQPNISNINSHNTQHNTFNLNVFLNEKCKHAMNINDFVDSLNLDLLDLENLGKLGYVEGISNIILKNLKALDITERPIHCADKKREIIYIKDENIWQKEDEDKKKLRKVIKKIASKNEKLFPKFKEQYPDYRDSDSRRSDQYSKIVIETLGGNGENCNEKEDKIVKKIVKEVVIDKSLLS